MTSHPTRPETPWTERPLCCDTRIPHLETRDLCIHYGGLTAVRNVDLTLNRGCVTAIVGPSGCGKSSVLHSLNRLTDLIPGCRVEGAIRLTGESIHRSDYPSEALRRRVGMIFQRPNPFPMSIRDNIAFPLKEHGMRSRSERADTVERSLREVGLWEEVKDRLQAHAPDLSGGQQQRLCLARALALRPEVILLDEPCSALDPVASGAVEDLIHSLRGQYTVGIVTHNLAQARRLADDLAVFWLAEGSGAVIEAGPADQVFEQPRHPTTAAYIRGARG